MYQEKRGHCATLRGFVEHAPSALMALLTTEALVLRGYKLGETSKVVVLLTRDRGKLRAVARGARGARPRYQSALEPLSEVRVTLYGRQGAELLRLGPGRARPLGVPRRRRAASRPRCFLSGCAELLDAFSPEGEAEERSTASRWRSCARPRPARARSCSAATSRPGCCGCTASTLRSTAAPAAAARSPGGALDVPPSPRTASSAPAAGRRPGPCCRRRRRALLVDVPRAARPSRSPTPAAPRREPSSRSTATSSRPTSSATCARRG